MLQDGFVLFFLPALRNFILFSLLIVVDHRKRVDKEWLGQTNLSVQRTRLAYL